MLTFANEILYVVLPLALVVTLRDPKRLAALGAVWLALALVLRSVWPQSFSPRMPRTMQPIGSLDGIPTGDLPDKKLVTRLSDFRALGLLDRTLEPNSPAWSSSFFPSWFGAES